MNSKIVNSVICISESQKNPKRYENLSMCKQYAKEAGCNVKDVFKFQYDDFEQSLKDLMRTLESNPEVNTIIISNWARISRWLSRIMDFLTALDRRGIAVYDVRMGKYITYWDIELSSILKLTERESVTKQKKRLRA